MSYFDIDDILAGETEIDATFITGCQKIGFLVQEHGKEKVF